MINAKVRSSGTGTNIGLIKNGTGEIMLASSEQLRRPGDDHGGALGIGTHSPWATPPTPLRSTAAALCGCTPRPIRSLSAPSRLVLNGSGGALGALVANFGSCALGGPDHPGRQHSLMNNSSSLEFSGADQRRRGPHQDRPWHEHLLWRHGGQHLCRHHRGQRRHPGAQQVCRRDIGAGQPRDRGRQRQRCGEAGKQRPACHHGGCIHPERRFVGMRRFLRSDRHSARHGHSELRDGRLAGSGQQRRDQHF